MIPAAKSPWFLAWFTGQARSRMRRTFGKKYLAGREHLDEALRRGPVLVVSNHCSWWDPMVVLVFSEQMLGADGYAMMDAKNLRRLPFFAKVGAFGVDRHADDGGEKALQYARGLLDRPGRLVWIFPQGQERPNHERPLQFFGGAARLAKRTPEATVIPVALHYAFGPVERPSVYMAVGEPIAAEAADDDEIRRAQAAAVEQQLQRIEREQSKPGTEGFEKHVLWRPGRAARLAERMLAMMTRPSVPRLRKDEGPRTPLALQPHEGE